MQVEKQRARLHTSSSSPSSRTRSTTVTAPSTFRSASSVAQAVSAEREHNTLRAASVSHTHRAPAARSHQNLRTMSTSNGSATVGNTALGRTAANMSNPTSTSTTPTSQGSRSRSGSSARYLSVNTQAASGPIPAVPQMSVPAVVHALGSVENGDAALTPTVASSYSPATSAVQGITNPNSSPVSSTMSPSGTGFPTPPVSPPSAVGAGSSNGQPKECSLTHKGSSRTVGGASMVSTGTSNATRKSSSASTARPAGSSKDASRTRDRDKERDKKDNKAPIRTRIGGLINGVDDADDEERDGYRRIPRMHLHYADPAPPTLMYWSRAPVWGALPTHRMRSHSATVVDNTTIWLFGGCDDKEFWRDVMCLDVETMEWTRPETIGEIPPPCRAHTATLVDRRLFVFGGGQGNMYYNTLYILDTVSRRWTYIPFSSAPTSSSSTSNSSHSHILSTNPALNVHPSPNIAAEPTDAEEESIPRPRRAHTTVLYKNRLVVFGGGNGAMALNDVWVLDVNVPPERMRWVKQRSTGNRPSPRGYHTANLIGNVMIVVGGSDGRQTFSDIFCLNLDTWHWSSVHSDRVHRRLAHTATQIGSYLFIMGGHDGSQYTNDLLLFNLVSLQFEPRPTRGPPPSSRGYHAAVLADGRLWIFGGYDGRSAHDDVHMLDLASSAYLSQVTGFYVNVE